MATDQQNRIAEDGVTRLLEIAASDRIQILSAPIQLPGVCGLCGTSRTDDRQYIDLGLWVEYYGQFYFCTFCMTQMVNRLGGLTVDQADDLNEQLNQARQTILDFQNQKAAYDGAIATLRDTGLFAGSDLIDASPIIPVAPKQDAQPSNGVSSGNKQGIIEPVSNIAESATEQRPNDVSSSGNNELDSWL